MMLAIADGEIAREIVRQCLERGPKKSICPSEVARAFAEDEAEWRALMPDVRRVADILCAEGRIAITQRGHRVSAVDTKGPIRFSLAVDQGALKRAVRAVARRPGSRSDR